MCMYIFSVKTIFIYIHMLGILNLTKNEIYNSKYT